MDDIQKAYYFSTSSLQIFRFNYSGYPKVSEH